MTAGKVQIPEQANVGMEPHAVPVTGHGWKVADRLELTVEGSVFPSETLVFTGDLRSWLDVDNPRIPIDDHRITVVNRIEQVEHTHHRRNLERLRQDRRVRGCTPGGERDPAQMLWFDRREIRERQLLGNQDRLALQAVKMVLDAEKISQQSVTDIAHVGRALPQIPIGHPPERPDEILDRPAKRRLRGESLVDMLPDPVEEAPVLEHHPVGVEKLGIDVGKAIRRPLLQVLDFVERAVERLAKAIPLEARIFAAHLLEAFERDEGLQDVGWSDSETGGRRDSREAGMFRPNRLRVISSTRPLVGLQTADRLHHALAVFVPLLLPALEALGEPGLHDNRAHVTGDRLQQTKLLASEAPAAERLHDEHS